MQRASEVERASYLSDKTETRKTHTSRGQGHLKRPAETSLIHKQRRFSQTPQDTLGTKRSGPQGGVVQMLQQNVQFDFRQRYLKFMFFSVHKERQLGEPALL